MPSAIGGHFGIARSVRSTTDVRTADPSADVDPPRFLDPWIDADGLIGGETICHHRTVSGRRAQCIVSLVRYLVFSASALQTDFALWEGILQQHVLFNNRPLCFMDI